MEGKELQDLHRESEKRLEVTERKQDWIRELATLSCFVFNSYSLAFLGHFSVTLCETYSAEKDVAIWQFN